MEIVSRQGKMGCFDASTITQISCCDPFLHQRDHVIRIWRSHLEKEKRVLRQVHQIVMSYIRLLAEPHITIKRSDFKYELGNTHRCKCM